MITLEIRSIYGDRTDRFLECKMNMSMDAYEYSYHPHFIIVAGTRYHRTGWNSDRKIIYYKA